MKDTSRKQNERAIWDQLAQSYDSKVMGTYAKAYDLTQQAILEEVKPGSRVLEVGCGTGIVSLAIAPHAGEVIGVDLSPRMIQQAKFKAREVNLQNLSFQEADAYELPFDDESFDLVLLTNLLHVVAEPDRALKESRRVLRAGGTLAAVTDCLAERAPVRIWPQLLMLRAMKLIGKLKYINFFRKSSLRKLLSANGILVHKEAVFHQAPMNFYQAGSKEG